VAQWLLQPVLYCAICVRPSVEGYQADGSTEPCPTKNPEALAVIPLREV
jgi:hypothetical protein